MCNVVGLKSKTPQVLFKITHRVLSWNGFSQLTTHCQQFLVVLQEIFPQLCFCPRSSDLVGGAQLGPGDFRVLQTRGLLNLGVQMGLSLLDSFVFKILNFPEITWK